MQGIPHYGLFLFIDSGGSLTMGHTISSRGRNIEGETRGERRWIAVGDQELVLPYPALNIRFGVSFVIVSFVSVVLGMLAAVCLWLSVLCVNQLLVLAGWGWDDFFVDPSASWLPVAGVGLVVLPGTLMVAWFVVLSAVHCGVPNRTVTTSSVGRYSFGVRIKREIVVRAVYAGSRPCERVQSKKRTITPLRA